LFLHKGFSISLLISLLMVRPIPFNPVY
jgi:hypothetical protein